MTENNNLLGQNIEFEELKNHIQKLKTELSMIVLERDTLKFIECKNIEIAYMLKLGNLEYKAFEAECTYLRLKRKIELMRAKLNRQEKIDINEIETVLDVEFEEYRKELEERINKMNEAIEYSKLDVLAPDEVRELKSLYRNIVKKLHPDFNSMVNSQQLNLFEKAVQAYKNGDLQTLRMIDAMIADPIFDAPTENSIDKMKKEEQRLSDMIKLVNEDIQNIKSKFPYKLKEYLNDEEKAQERKALLQSYIKIYESYIKDCKEIINEMLG